MRDSPNVVACERISAGDHFVHHHAQRVDVRCSTNDAALYLLWRHVRGGTYNAAGLRENRLQAGLALCAASQTEIRDNNPRWSYRFREDHIAGLEIPVYDADRVSGVKRRCHLYYHRQRLFSAQAPGTANAV